MELTSDMADAGESTTGPAGGTAGGLSSPDAHLLTGMLQLGQTWQLGAIVRAEMESIVRLSC